MKPYLRPLVQSKIKKESESWLRVLTYNVLAQSLIRRDSYPTNGNIIRWNVRYPLLVEEIESYKPNLMFLQEVDKSKMSNWEPLLESINMDHEYLCPPNKQHGVLVAWDSQVFSYDPKTVRKIYYDDIASLSSQTVTGNAGLLLILKRNGSEESYIAGTTHMYWHPDADYERFRQAAIFVSKAAELQVEYNVNTVIFGADFNSTPDSPAYLLLSGGLQVTEDMQDALRKSARATHFGRIGALPGEGKPSLLGNNAGGNHGDHGNDEAVKKVVEFVSNLKAPGLLNLRSCYKEILGEEPEFTNWTQDFRATIDYIFISSPLIPQAVLELPTAENMGPEPSSLPRAKDSQGYPSDHIALMAELARLT